MLEFSIDEKSLNVSLNEKINALKELDNQAGYLAMKLATDIASDLRTLAYKRYFSIRYKEGSHSSLGLGSNPMRKDKKGRRLVGFTMKSHRDNWKEAKFTAYPMNLYEHDTKPYSKPYRWIPKGHVRPGTNIMRQRLPNDLKTLLPINEAKFIARLNDKAKKMEL